MSETQSNILLITTDQQRFDAAGEAGPSFLRTPHYDYLCRRGILFTSAYSDCPICVPARVSIMTGKTAGVHGVLSNYKTSDFIGRQGTLPSVLRRLGYQTAAVGKMHFGPERVRHGFDEMILPADYYNEMRRSGLPYQPMRHGLGQNELYPALATVPESLTLTSWIAEQCVEYIKERRDPTLPFFLWCSFSKPHPPLDPPEPYYSMYRKCPIPEPVYSKWSKDERCPGAFKYFQQGQSYDKIPPETIREARAAYYGLITQIDYNMGRVFAALQDMNILDDTLILYTSDHGEFIGDHHSGSKVFFHEGSAHIPFVLRLPQSPAAGTRCASLVTHADILPTLASAAGGRAPEDADGIDLAALTRGDTRPRGYLVAMSPPEGPVPYSAITDGRWKYMWYPEGPAEQLFDLKNDAMEEYDLAFDKKFKNRRVVLRDELIQRLAALGSGFVRDGRLRSFPARKISEAERRRTQSWPGYQTEHYETDTRH